MNLVYKKIEKGAAMRRTLLLGIALLVVFAMTAPALAFPRLETYITDSRYYTAYKSDRMSWISNNENFDLKVIGQWRGGYRARPAYDYLDCQLAISIPRNQSGRIWINGIEVTSFSGFQSAIPSNVNAPFYLPLQSPSLSSRYNFTGIGRIDNDQRNAWNYSRRLRNPGWGDELVLDVVVSGYDWVHFDAVGVNSRGRTVASSPYRNASYFATPEPGTLSLLGLGLLGMVPLLRKKKR